MTLVSADGTTLVPMAVETFREPRLDLVGGHWHCRLPPRRVPARAGDVAGAGRRRPGVGLRAHHDRGRRDPHLAHPRPLDRRLERRGADAGRQRRRRPHRAARQRRATWCSRWPTTRPTPCPRRLDARGRRHRGLPTRPTPERVVVNHLDQGRQELLIGDAATRPASPASGRCGSTFGALPMPTSNTTPAGPITRPQRVRVRHRRWRSERRCWRRRAPSPHPRSSTTRASYVG